MLILVPNLGSTSLKYQILEMPTERVLARGRLERVTDYRAAIASIEIPGRLDAVAFKAVHGGEDFRGTYRVNAEVLAALEEFLPAAPAHNKIYLAAMRAFAEALPEATLVAAFETEFHATMPEYAGHYGVPRDWYRDLGIRRYGFHGASHQYIAWRTPEFLGRPVPRLISCHLGGSSSICAIRDGRSIDTTMGFSAQSGLENAARSGDVDAFAVLYALEREGWTLDQVRAQLAGSGGLAGISGVAGGDVRDIEQAAAQGSSDAQLALDLFAYQVRKTIGAYAAALGGLDAVVFTGGIGENSARLRARCLEGLGFLGIELSPESNEQGSGDRVLSPEEAPVKVLALATNEEIVVARRAYRLLSAS